MSSNLLSNLSNCDKSIYRSIDHIFSQSLMFIKKYVINTEIHIHYFLFLFIALVYFVQEYIYILVQNKLVQ